MAMNIQRLTANEGKNIIIKTTHGSYARYPVKTPVIMQGTNMEAVLAEYVTPFTQPNDMLFISEKVIAILQGRALPIREIKVSRMANFLYRFVYKSPYGIGLGSPWTMELAIRDIGLPIILFAAFVSAVSKPFGIRGLFYKIVGMKGRAIDGPCECTIPPYNQYAKFAPQQPHKVARSLREQTGHDVVIMDSNDLSCEVLGKSNAALDDRLLKQIFADNPLGQGRQQTPIAIVRKVNAGSSGFWEETQ